MKLTHTEFSRKGGRSRTPKKLRAVLQNLEIARHMKIVYAAMNNIYGQSNKPKKARAAKKKK
jgi:hypothetical protein